MYRKEIIQTIVLKLSKVTLLVAGFFYMRVCFWAASSLQVFYSILFKRNFILAFICLLRAYTYALLHNHQSENVAKMDYSEAFYDQILLYTFFILIVSAGGEHQKWSCGLKKKKKCHHLLWGMGWGSASPPYCLGKAVTHAAWLTWSLVTIYIFIPFPSSQIAGLW